MPTHALGPGTCNLSVNILREDRGVLGRLAFLRDMSLGALVRTALARLPSLTAEASKSEEYDVKAEQLLAHVLTDERIPQEDREELRQAMALVHKSAEADHSVAQLSEIKEVTK